ncbi:MAG: hypothetical protein Fur0022_32350 [Anaerolineales bacterium]
MASIELLSSKPISEDGFEEEGDWQMFEEIVGGSKCYGTGIGSVTLSTDVAYEGTHSLRVWANEALSPKSNHVIGYKKIFDHGLNGILEYQIHAYISPETDGEGQTGPEFSMQNTRNTGITNTTAIAGIQYIANPYWETGYWKIWNKGKWENFVTTTQPLQPGNWYTLTLTANYWTNEYQTFSIQGKNRNETFDASKYVMAEEKRGFEEAFVITLESENLWNNCGKAGIFDYKVYYDQVTVHQKSVQLFLPVMQK